MLTIKTTLIPSVKTVLPTHTFLTHRKSAHSLKLAVLINIIKGLIAMSLATTVRPYTSANSLRDGLK